MALLRRSAWLLPTRMRFVKLWEKDQSCITYESNVCNRGYVHRPDMQMRRNSHYQSHGQASIPSNITCNQSTSDSAKPESKTASELRAISIDTKTSGMCYAEVLKAIDQESKKKSVDQSTLLCLLEYCSDMIPDAPISARLNLVNRIWHLVANINEPPSVDHYNVLLSIYKQNSQYLNVDEFLKNMKAPPNSDTYHLLLDAAAEIGDYSQVLLIMTRIKDMGYQVTEATFNSLMLAHSINNHIDQAHAVMKTMEAAGIEPSADTFFVLLRGYAYKGDIENLTRILKTSNLNATQIMSIVRTLSLSGNGDYISRVIQYLPQMTDITFKSISYTIVELTYSGLAKDAFKVINCFRILDGASDTSLNDLTDIFLYEIVKAETSIVEVFEICESLMSSTKNSSPLLRVTEAALRLQKQDIALRAFEIMKNQGIEIRPHFYWPLLVNTASTKGETDVLKLVKHMVENGVYLDDETLCHYVFPFLCAPKPLVIIRKLQDCGLKMSDLFGVLLTNYLDQGNLKDAIALTEKIKVKLDLYIVIERLVSGCRVTESFNETVQFLRNINTDSDQNGKFFEDLMANERIKASNEELASLIFAFDKHNLKISKTVADALELRILQLAEPERSMKTLKKLVTAETSTNDEIPDVWIPHPELMSLEQLENHLIDLTAKGMNTRGTLRRLLQAYCRKNNFKKAEETAELFKEKGFEWTSGMISSMFSLYVTNNMIDKADVYFRDLKTNHKDFIIDDYKVIDYATALVKNKKFEKGLEVLREQENVTSGPKTIRNCWRLLNAVAADGNLEATKKTLDILLEKGYCEVSIHVLSPLVRTNLLNGNLEEAIKQFKECALVYKLTPLKQELLRALVDISTDNPDAQKQLTDVLMVIKSISGEAAGNSHLFTALAARNKHKELQSFIKMPAVNQKTMEVSAKNLMTEQNLTALQGILKACRNVMKLDTRIIYDLILTLCSRSGDYKTALEIWDRMQAEDIIPLPKFTENLINFLNSQKVSLPDELQAKMKREKR
ncbi:leucine-rich PPR motif-containing protein, mitochondrial [Neodiprion pinetum]|uniref:Leucine-rich PPR motif-containing protein, mitochondrial n=1 Tax=Neodiprion lecontei TaxID=441921 RepID=A0A6J0C1Y1_NEOLC|nr:leucine-rich PPR motif-containing protein, mitochondrial [Neodiprion lecontei]XP_046485579.1 leucine-rich PPR motif-containing protein, mitochondrial [Neodiprion pinetum]XP_046485590.1 leucine-rich PPR motif-containing protein, mitochondrial [Neodiprion pinetum]XP_046597769.1 leucine-rich PPR motif-containing protein, mitochondrial [Neodiprion lecontei]